MNAHVYRDSRGFVWISSVDGLNRFDGLTIRLYRPYAQKPHTMFGQNVISPFLEDAEGNIWFCTYEALNCYRRRSDDFEHWQLTDPTTGDTIREDYYAFFLERSGHLWLHLGEAEKGRIYCFDIHTQKYELLGPLFGNRCLADTSAEGVLRSIYAFQYGDTSGLRRAPVLPNRQLGATRCLEPGGTIFDLWVQNDTLVWLASKKGLVALNPHVPRRLPELVDSTEKTSIRAIEPLPDQLFALGSHGKGLLLFDRKQKKFTASIQRRPGWTPSISDNTLEGVYLDPGQTLWVSDWGYGLNFSHLGKPKVRRVALGDLYQPADQASPTAEQIHVLAQGHEGQVWMATRKGTVLRCEGRGPARIVRYQEGLPTRRVLGLFCDQQGVVWVAAEAGLFYLEKGSQRFQRIPGPLALRLDCGWQQTGDGQILLSGDGFHVIKRQPNGGYSLEKYPLHPVLDAMFCPYFYQDRAGTMYCNDNYATTVVLRPDGSLHRLPLNNLRACWEDADGKTIWLATTYGLAKLDEKPWPIHSTMSPTGCPTNTCTAFSPIRRGFCGCLPTKASCASIRAPGWRTGSPQPTGDGQTLSCPPGHCAPLPATSG